MSVAIVTGASGLIGSETVRFLHVKGMTVVGIDNNMRSYFFGSDGSTDWNARRMQTEFNRYIHEKLDIRDQAGIQEIFKKYAKDIAMVVHCAAQPSHDWAAREPVTDFTVNALATLLLLEATRMHSPEPVLFLPRPTRFMAILPTTFPWLRRSNVGNATRHIATESMA